MRTETRPIAALDRPLRRAMAELLCASFDGADAVTFEADLADKTHAVLMFDRAERLVGFSTFACYTAPGPDDRPATIVCSGDTIVAPSAWGSAHLPATWVKAVHRLHRQSGNDGLYWLLITSGYRTYRFLPVFVKSYVPAVDREADPGLLACMARLARHRWGAQYDERSQIVRLGQPQRLRPSLSHVPDQHRHDKHIAFFLQRNPGHAEGDELVSFASLAEDNLTRAGLRMLRSPSGPPAAGSAAS